MCEEVKETNELSEDDPETPAFLPTHRSTTGATATCLFDAVCRPPPPPNEPGGKQRTRRSANAVFGDWSFGLPSLAALTNRFLHSNYDTTRTPSLRNRNAANSTPHATLLRVTVATFDQSRTASRV